MQILHVSHALNASNTLVFVIHDNIITRIACISEYCTAGSTINQFAAKFFQLINSHTQ